MRPRWLAGGPGMIAGGLALAALAAAAPDARAQTVRLPQVQELQDPSPEAELPDIDAIERGARPPASVSFRRPNATPPRPTDDKKEGAKEEGGKTGEGGPTRHLEGAAAGLSPPGGLYGLDGTQAQDPGADGQPAGPVPELHPVKKGDTLWSICQQYFNDPWRWPKLWAENPQITNPHWIFPGDTIRLRAADAPATAPVAAGAGTGISSNRAGSLTSKALVLREVGFIDAGNLQTSAVITGSREEKIMLSSGDQAYARFSAQSPLRAGERYTVFVADRENPVRVPGTGQVLGYMVRIFGDMVVDQVAERNTARGVLVDLLDPVERGHQVSPLIRQFKRIEPRASAVNLEAKVVAAFSPTRMLAPETFVVLSRGKRDGVQVGNRSFVVRRGDGYRPVMEGWDHFDPNFPKEVVSELWVVAVNESASIAWIVRSIKEIRVGETVEMRKGH